MKTSSHIIELLQEETSYERRLIQEDLFTVEQKRTRSRFMLDSLNSLNSLDHPDNKGENEGGRKGGSLEMRRMRDKTPTVRKAIKNAMRVIEEEAFYERMRKQEMRRARNARAKMKREEKVING